jgi:phytol kinase
MFVTLVGSIVWLRSMDFLAYRGVLEATLSRKLIHIGTGPLFVLCWIFFSPAPIARYLAAVVPLLLTLRLLAIGMGWLQDPATVQAMTRTGNPQEILRGPLYYGIAFIICTVLFWRNSPVGILALMIMCGGDGLADIIGRRFGKHKLPFNPNKSWAGSAAMLLGSIAFGFAYLMLFNDLGHFHPPLNLAYTAGAVSAIALAATLVEALPIQEIDNITLTLVSLLLGIWLF